MWQYHKISMDHSKIIDTFETYQAAGSNSGRPGLAQIWALRGPSRSDRWAGPMSGSCCRWWRCSACRGFVVMVAGLLQRGDGLNGPIQGPAGPYWDWPTPAVWQAVSLT